MSMLMVVLSWGIFLGSAQAWWNEQWPHRKKIVLNASASGADTKENLAEFPVLIRLHSGNFDFTKVMENGEDIRFVGSDDVTLLKHHIESYDSFDEIGLVWVKAPAVTAASDQGFIWIYYGNTAAAKGDDKANSFDSLYRNVLHFNELEGTPKDSSSYNTHPGEYTAGLGMPGAIGKGATFSGAGVLKINDNPAFDFSNGLTLSTWIKIANPQADAVLFDRSGNGAQFIVSIQENALMIHAAKGEEIFDSAGITQVPQEGWHHLAVTFAPGGKVTVYLDGVPTETLDTQIEPGEPQGDILVGADAQGGRTFFGELDEFRVSATVRSADWIKACQASQGPNASFATLMTEEMGEATSSGMPVFYLATIFEHITLDGMVVIGLLIFMGMMCWVVMIMKGMFLWGRSKKNDLFMQAYQLSADPVSLADRDTEYGGSGLFNIYQTGCASLNLTDRTGEDGSVKKMSGKAIESFKTVLERGLNNELRRLNAWMIILIISISGGPFLGLLGTVWGVMNTFAAMAEAGEANIMAIAPGVASALATTVFGLIVAIPALFGYNFLAGQIKNMTAEGGLFVDQFGLKVDAVYGDD